MEKENIYRNVWTACSQIINRGEEPTYERVQIWLSHHGLNWSQRNQDQVQTIIEQWYCSLFRQKLGVRGVPDSVRDFILEVWESAIDRVAACQLVETNEKVAQLNTANSLLKATIETLKQELASKERIRLLLENEIRVIRQELNKLENSSLQSNKRVEEIQIPNRELILLKQNNEILTAKLRKLQSYYLVELSSAFESLRVSALM